MGREIVRQLIGGVWRTSDVPGGGGGGSLPVGAVFLFGFATAAAVDDTKGSNGDYAIVDDSRTILKKTGGAWS